MPNSKIRCEHNHNQFDNLWSIRIFGETDVTISTYNNSSQLNPNGICPASLQYM